MERDPAHGSALFQPAVLSGEHEIQLFGADLCVIKEHFVEIADPVKKDTVRIFFFCFQVLRHHGRHFLCGQDSLQIMSGRLPDVSDPCL